MENNYYYKIDVSLKDGETYQRVLETRKQISLDIIEGGILRDVFFKVEDGDLESVKKINIEEISREIYEELQKNKEIISLILGEDGYVRRSLVGIN